MNTGAKVGLTIGGVVIAVGLSYLGYKEYEKDECAKNGNTWSGDLLTGSCSGGVTPVKLVSPGNLVCTIGTPDSNGNASFNASWNQVTGATSYTLTVNGTQFTTSSLNYSGTINVGTAATVPCSVEACN